MAVPHGAPAEALADRVPPVALVVAGATSVQFGAALAATIFDDVGPAGASMLRLVFAAVVLAVVQGQREERPRPEPREVVPVDAQLRLVGRGVSVSQGGVLVVPVVLQDLGPGLTVTSARAYAEPVREDPVITPPEPMPRPPPSFRWSSTTPISATARIRRTTRATVSMDEVP